MRMILIIAIFLIPSLCQADTPYKVQSGYAYETCNGVNTGKLYLKPGAVRMEPVGCALTEVQSAADLDAIAVTPSNDLIKTDLKNQMVENDIKSVRPLRAIILKLVNGQQADQADISTLNTLENDTNQKRNNLKNLTP